MTKKLIVNADDFGRHSYINAAVRQGVEQGLIRSATVMVTGEAFQEAVDIAKTHPELGLGIHFTLVNGKPVLPIREIPSLIDPKTGEFFPSHKEFVKQYLSGKVRRSDVKKECKAQLEAFLATGLRPTHADSHQHMHVLPGIIDIILSLCEGCGVKRVRIPAIPVSLLATRKSNLGEQVGRMGLHLLAERARSKAKARGFLTPDYFGGIVAGEAVDLSNFRTILLQLQEGTTEVMLQPGTDNAVLQPAIQWDHDFEAELTAVTAPQNLDLVKSQGISVINFTDL